MTAAACRAARGFKPGVEVRPQRVADERSLRKRRGAVPGDVAHDHREAPVLEREEVVEVTARGGALGGSVGDRGADGAEACGYRGQQRGLQEADLLGQVPALTLEASRT